MLCTARPGTPRRLWKNGGRPQTPRYALDPKPGPPCLRFTMFWGALGLGCRAQGLWGFGLCISTSYEKVFVGNSRHPSFGLA